MIEWTDSEANFMDKWSSVDSEVAMLVAAKLSVHFPLAGWENYESSPQSKPRAWVKSVAKQRGVKPGQAGGSEAHAAR